jgi:[ribosomal protein S5]-alanine N-acetyltransferase
MQIDVGEYLLTYPSVEDAIDLVHFYQRNAAFFEQNIPVITFDYKTEMGVKMQLNRDIIEGQRGNLLVLYVREKQTNHLIARISYTSFKRANYQSCQLGAMLDKSYVNKGIMSACLPKANAFVLDKLQFHRIESTIITSNKASWKMVEKIGFEREGLARKYLFFDGDWQDCFLYAYVRKID